MTKTITITAQVTDDAEVFCIDQRPVILTRTADAHIMRQPISGAIYDDTGIGNLRLAIPFTIYRRRLAGRGISVGANAVISGVIVDIPSHWSDLSDWSDWSDATVERPRETIILVSSLGWSEGPEIKFPTIDELIAEMGELNRQMATVAEIYPTPVKSSLLEPVASCVMPTIGEFQ